MELRQILKDVAQAEAQYREATRKRADVHYEAIKYLADNRGYEFLKLDLRRLEIAARHG